MGVSTDNNAVPHDPVQEAMGTMGKWQIIITVVISLVNFPAAWTQFAIVVIAPRQQFTCLSPKPFNSSDSMERACLVKVNESLPEIRCSQFSYDESAFKSTIVSEWDLVCDRKYLLRMVQPLTQTGILLGKLVFGILADRIGRRIPLLTAVTLQAIFLTITSFVPTFPLFLIFKSLSAVATGGTMLISFVIGSQVRAQVLTLIHVQFILGILTIPLFSYMTKTYHGFWLMISLPSFGLLSYYRLIPESPRWLLAVGKVGKARKILLKAAKTNKISETKVAEAIENHEYKSLIPSIDSKFETEKKSYGLMYLIRTLNMSLITLCIIFNWLKSGMVHFGTQYYLGHVSENVLSDLAISATFQLPSVLIAYFLISRVSRLKLLIVLNVLAGFSFLLIIPFYYNPTVRLVLMIVSLNCTGISIETLRLYTGEVFPTVVRNSAVAVCSVAAKIGTIIAPVLIDYEDDLTFWVIPVVFGMGPILGAVVCMWLPETTNCKLPEIIEDCENYDKRNKQKSANK
ncbi:sugar transporter domain-containing protein [Phthorimaea operculella]|nr:sugar transporter domain-containing protein [Phthorimaea operculella]